MTQLISKMGARRVITMDLFDNRLAVSKLMGATHSVNTSQADPVAAVKKITDEMMCDIGEPSHHATYY
jgi:S-(hydroxymethyl)mycothiol dehydrogenase